MVKFVTLVFRNDQLVKTDITNDIIKRQNNQENIHLLKAMRVAYSHSKNFQFFDLLSIIVAVVFPLLIIYIPQWITWVELISVLFGIGYFFVEKIRSNKAEQGAKIQEEFDIGLFKITWNNKKYGNKIIDDIIDALSKKYNKADLYDWYSTNITSSLPHNMASLLCQRINLSWEMRLKIKFGRLLLFLLLAYYIIPSGYFFYYNLGFRDFIFLLIPSFGFLIFTIKTRRDIKDQIDTKKETLEEIDNDWDNFVGLGKIVSEIDLRAYQDKIFENRLLPERIPDWFYKLNKKKDELTTNDIIKRKIQQVT